jgi:phosphoesterase RecJ-like protein
VGSFKKIKNIIESNEEFLLIGHESPDGDCLGSILAFGEFLKGLGKTVTIACRDVIPEAFKFLPEIENVKRDFLLGGFNAVFLLDNGDFKRTGFSDRLRELDKKRIPIVNIDHHQKNDLWKIANINHADDTASSTSELIYDLIVGLKGTISPKMATLLLCGIYTDTGGFQHVNTKERVFEITSTLLNRGAKLKEISKNLKNTRPTSMPVSYTHLTLPTTPYV